MGGIFYEDQSIYCFFNTIIYFAFQKANIMNYTKEISQEEKNELLTILKKRFEKNIHRHPNTIWENVVEKLEENPSNEEKINIYKKEVIRILKIKQLKNII